MPEGELVLALDGRNAYRAHELPAGELVQVAAYLVAVSAPDGGDGAEPEHAADDGSVVEQRLELGSQRVEPGGDERVHGLGDGDLPRRRRRSASMRANCSAYSGFPPARSSKSVCVSTGSTLRSSRACRSRLASSLVSGESEIVVALRFPPPHAAAARRARVVAVHEEQERHLPTPVEEVLQEVEQGFVGPVQVLHDEDARPPRRHLLEEPPPRGERLLAARRDALALRADEGREPGFQPCRLVHVRERLGHGPRELAACSGGVVRLEDSGFGLHDLAKCPERDALAVRAGSARGAR